MWKVSGSHQTKMVRPDLREAKETRGKKEVPRGSKKLYHN